MDKRVTDERSCGLAVGVRRGAAPPLFPVEAAHRAGPNAAAPTAPPAPDEVVQMNLIYADNYRNACTFALHQELMPGDWTWIRDPATVRAHPRADLYMAPHWEAHPHRDDIDVALQSARAQHRLGTVTDLSGPAVW